MIRVSEVLGELTEDQPAPFAGNRVPEFVLVSFHLHTL
jgi:hypothetical protein